MCLQFFRTYIYIPVVHYNTISWGTKGFKMLVSLKLFFALTLAVQIVFLNLNAEANPESESGPIYCEVRFRKASTKIELTMLHGIFDEWSTNSSFTRLTGLKSQTIAVGI